MFPHDSTDSVLSGTDIKARLERCVADDLGVREQLASVSDQLRVWLEAVERADEVIRKTLAAGGGIKDRKPLTSSKSGRGAQKASEPVTTQPPDQRPPPSPDAAGPPAAPPVAAAAAPPPQEPALDDEQLLATLDEETANMIRVRRRLEGNRRSVRECLAELRASKPGGSRGEGKKGGWWS